MEKNNKTSGLPNDLDDLRLKDHLNASFDIDNIKVSEDLIARTLKAIGESGSQEEQPKESNKIKHFPVRRLVSAAAVILVLFVGINVLQNGMTGNKKDSRINMDTGTAGDSVAEQETMDIYSIADESSTSIGNSMKSNAALDSAAADTAQAESQAPLSDEKVAPFSTEIAKDANKTDGGESSSLMGSTLFSGLYPVTFDTVETFTISKNDGTKIALTNAGNKVSEIYTLLDGYPLTAINTQTNENENSWTYEAVITTTDKQTYTIIFSDDIQVSQVTEATKSSPLTYSVEDMDNLMKKMDDFYGSMK